ncbi:MAG: glycoside hydrolase family 57 protein, partial [Planctomycetota bacterium]
MTPAHLAFVWHQHQPYYPDDVSGEVLMPWVRLHGTKDYYGMARHIEEVPEFRCTINLVPSLLVQLEAYVDGRSDRHLDLARLPADGLSEADAIDIVDHFFWCHADTMVRPHARYQELHDLRGFGRSSGEDAARRFTERDLRDLQVWQNLTWFHELAFEHDAELAEFRTKGRHWTEEEKHWLLDKQRQILAEVIPLHKKLSDGGQVEITTTPFYHPILPLLWDKHATHEAMPGHPLPEHCVPYEEDAKRHLRDAVAYHERLFGVKPKGMWPSEGSVSQAVLGPIADVGIEWIATDEEILAASTNGLVGRDGNGHVRNASMLFRPWVCGDDGKDLGIVFREHALSDGIGFHYQRSEANAAADDLLGKVEGIRQACGDSVRPPLVPIILDGENCWEYFGDGGVAFLRTLYRKAAESTRVVPTRVCDYLEQHPPTDRVDRLFAGSWISHNFAIWIGHEEDRVGWDRLHETREFLEAAKASGHHDPEALATAQRELDIAEGSDWFWWYGDDHSSPQDALFDQLFRRHLKNVYLVLGADPPGVLDVPISNAEVQPTHTQPTGFLPVKVDGRSSYFEWAEAGTYVSGNERGTMTIVTEGLIRSISFGFDATRFLLRLDTAGEAAADLATADSLRVVFHEPAGLEAR